MPEAFVETVLRGDSSHIFWQSLAVIQCAGRAWEFLHPEVQIGRTFSSKVHSCLSLLAQWSISA